MKGKQKKKGHGSGKRNKVEKNYNSATWESDTARALARTLANKGKWAK